VSGKTNLVAVLWADGQVYALGEEPTLAASNLSLTALLSLDVLAKKVMSTNTTRSRIYVLEK